MEVHSEPGRANDTHSRLDRVGVRDGVHSSQLKAWRQSRGRRWHYRTAGGQVRIPSERAADEGQVNFVELR